jgi:hypothetical protein
VLQALGKAVGSASARCFPWICRRFRACSIKGGLREALFRSNPVFKKIGFYFLVRRYQFFGF